jgi:protein-tyrosine-phosphatase
MPRILVVCTANICRSPVGEALLRDRLRKRGLNSWAVTSAGTWAQAGLGAARYSMELLAELGLDLSTHRSRVVEQADLDEADLVLCMEVGHTEALQVEFPENGAKVHLISEMAGMSHGIADPFGRSIEMYRTMIAALTEIIDSGLDQIIAVAEENAGKRGK